MNNLVKERIALELAKEATKILLNQTNVISLQWKTMKNNSMSDDNIEENSPHKVMLRVGMTS